MTTLADSTGLTDPTASDTTSDDPPAIFDVGTVVDVPAPPMGPIIPTT